MIWGAWSFPRVPVLKLVSYKLKMCVSGNFGSCLKEVKPLVVYDGEQGIVLEPWRGIGLNLELIWATPRYFIFLR